jgi:hypothetical protein
MEFRLRAKTESMTIAYSISKLVFNVARLTTRDSVLSASILASAAPPVLPCAAASAAGRGAGLELLWRKRDKRVFEKIKRGRDRRPRELT